MPHPRTGTPFAPTSDATVTLAGTAAATPILATIPPNTIAPTPRVTPTLPVVGDKYTVQAGDTLYGICKRLGVDYDDMVELNKIADPNSLKIGQVLKIPPPPPSDADSTATPKS